MDLLAHVLGSPGTVRALASLDPVVQHMDVGYFSLSSLQNECLLSIRGPCAGQMCRVAVGGIAVVCSCSQLVGGGTRLLIVYTPPENLCHFVLTGFGSHTHYCRERGTHPSTSGALPWAMWGSDSLANVSCVKGLRYLNKTGIYCEEESMKGSRIGHQPFLIQKIREALFTNF